MPRGLAASRRVELLDVLALILPTLVGILFVSKAKTSLTMSAEHLQQLQIRERYGYQPSFWRPIAALELAAGLGVLVGLVVRPAGIAAAIVLTLVVLGEVLARLTTRTAPTAVMPGVLLALVLCTIAVWLLA